MKKRLIFFLNIILVLLSGWGNDALAQVAQARAFVDKGDSLRVLYRFEESASLYSKALDILGQAPQSSREDSLYSLLVKDRMLLSENGKAMSEFVYSPTVVARHIFSVEDFFLYYPLKDRSWRAAPNQLDSVAGPFSKAIYAPADDDVIYYSAADQEGIRNVYKTVFADTIWTLPALLNEQLTSVADEIYPMLSPDRKHLYFASCGLHGVGGFDLYVSEWDDVTGDWSVPVNMGFPYSSPANDYLFINTDDGRYTLFASDRDCPKDSVWVYVLEYDSMPVRSEISDPLELQALSRLEPVSMIGDKVKAEVKSAIPENVDTRRYMEKMAHVRALRDTIAAYENAISEDREIYAMIDSESERNRIAEKILSAESMIPEFQKKLNSAMAQLQEIEMDFLFSGVVIDPDNLVVEAEREIIGESNGYAFSRMSMGEPLLMEIEKPKPKFDFSFKVLDTAQIVDVAIPEGIVYQIQLFTLSKPASLKTLKGLSPVFEVKTSSGKYIYRVGVFREYKDVLSHLNTVKRLGFKGACIIGYVDGKEMSVNNVRAVEEERKKAAPKLFRVVIAPTGGELDPVAMEGIRQQSGGKDVARTEGRLIVGPFDDKARAAALVDFVKVMGYGGAELEQIEM